MVQSKSVLITSIQSLFDALFLSHFLPFTALPFTLSSTYHQIKTSHLLLLRNHTLSKMFERCTPKSATAEDVEELMKKPSLNEKKRLIEPGFVESSWCPLKVRQVLTMLSTFRSWHRQHQQQHIV